MKWEQLSSKVLTLILGMFFSHHAFSSEVERVSLIMLLARPAEFNAKEVTVRGYYCKTNHEAGLFLSKRDCDDRNMLVGVRLNLPTNIAPANNKPKSATLITIKGTFTSWAHLIAIDTQYENGEIVVTSLYPY